MSYLRDSHRPGGLSRTEELERAITTVIATEGAAALSLRRIAREMRIGASTLIDQYDGKTRLLGIVLHGVARRRRLAVELTYDRHGLLSLLPDSEERLGDEVVWRALCEHGRTLDELGLDCAARQQEERQLLHWLTGSRLTRTELDCLVGMVEGLCLAITRPVDPLPPGRARAALALHVQRSGVEWLDPQTVRRARGSDAHLRHPAA